MKNKSRPRATAMDRRQQLTGKIKKHALGARSDGLHPVRVRHAVACGRALSALKELLGHGRWIRWVEERCGVNRMTANRYMRLAKGRDQVTPSMTIREAYIAAGVITPTVPGAS